MNKKGFTLVELLAVIAIIALIGGLALGIVAKLSSERRDTGNDFVKSFVINAAKQYVKANESVKDTIKQNKKQKITYKTLVDKGYLSSNNIKNLKTGEDVNYYVCVRYNSSNNTFSYKTNEEDKCN